MRVTARQIDRLNEEYQAAIRASLELDKKEVKDRPAASHGWRLLKTISELPYLKFSCPDCHQEHIIQMPTSGNGLTLEKFTIRHCRKTDLPPIEMFEKFCRLVKANVALLSGEGPLDEYPLPNRRMPQSGDQPIPAPFSC